VSFNEKKKGGIGVERDALYEKFSEGSGESQDETKQPQCAARGGTAKALKKNIKIRNRLHREYQSGGGLDDLWSR
jgi:hypothetical protein